MRDYMIRRIGVADHTLYILFHSNKYVQTSCIFDEGLLVPASGVCLAEQAESTGTSHEESASAPVERNVRIGPAAQYLLRSSGLRAEDIRPTGPRGILTKGDVLQAIESGAKPSKVRLERGKFS